ncbi:hypothetical protein LZ554_007774 [Drepanopeziza brunnea f. sp. 'monogermtubi']|nr:hypothetical protein LZ554_007774 [Drepanopeziza brunnea f. sp. 'monogermtubi']
MADHPQNFQPQVGTDTTHGPHLHQYIPRSDGSILVGGVSYIPQHVAVPATVASVSVPVPVVSAPIVVQPASPVVQAPYPSNPFYSFLYPSYIAPAMVQPIMVPQQAYIPPPQPMYVPQSVYGYPAASSPYQTYPIPTNPAFSFQQPAYNTLGYTAGEMLTQNMGLAMNSDANKKQEMKPADDDPYRMYWCLVILVILGGTRLMVSSTALDCRVVGYSLRV